MDAPDTAVAGGTSLVGGPAPPFALEATDGVQRRLVTLEEHAGRWLMVLFYPRDFTFVCPTELTAFSAEIDEFTRRRCSIVGVSVDPVERHEEWLRTPAEDGGLGPLHFPLASDPDGAAARAYGVFIEKDGVAGRGLFLVDPDGVLQYQVVHNLGTGRSTGETLRVLDALQQGGLCPSNWTRGDGTIDPSMALRRGTVLGHYRIASRIGQGGFAQVLSAWDTTLERVVALKVIRPGRKLDRSQVLAEARAAAGLAHPNICAIYAVEEIEGLPIIAMEYLRGHTLARRLREGPLPAEEVRTVGRALCAGLGASHARGIVHGDLKPSNVMLMDDGGVKILDFGVARRTGDAPLTIDQVSPAPPEDSLPPTVMTVSDRARDTRRTVRGGARGGRRQVVIQGTPAYLAPEVLAGAPATPASDVFVAGLLLAEMLTGRRVVGGRRPQESFRALRLLDAGAVAAGVPRPFRDAVRAALEPDPGRRLPAGELAAML